MLEDVERESDRVRGSHLSKEAVGPTRRQIREGRLVERGGERPGPVRAIARRTGDSSSPNAQSPFNRMGQHLGLAANSCMLRRHLEKHGQRPEECAFRLVALGPLEAESMAIERAEHNQRRDLIAAMEKALADKLREAGCVVMNRVTCRKALDATRFSQVPERFRGAFPHLAAADAAAATSRKA